MANKRSVRPFAFLFNYDGIDERKNILTAKPNVADLIQNMHYYAPGVYASYLNGYSHLGSALEGGARIDGLAWYADASQNDYLLAAVNGKVKSLDTTSGAVLAEIGTTLTAGNYVDFQTFKGSVFLCEKTITPLKWAGSGSMSTMSGLPLTSGGNTYDKPKFVEKFNNRLVFGDFNGATAYHDTIVISDDLTPETFTIGTSDTNGAIIPVAPGDGQWIRGLFSLFMPSTTGVGEEALLIFKDRSVYSLSGDTPNTFDINLVSKDAGALNNNAIVQAGADILFMGEEGIYSLTTAAQGGNAVPKVIGSDDVKQTYQRINLSQRDNAWAAHIKSRQEVWFAFPTGSNTNPDTILVYRYGKDAKEPATNWIVRQNVTPTCACVLAQRFFTGDNAGFVNEWFAASDYAGTAFNWIYRYPYYDFGQINQNKRVSDLTGWFQLTTDTTITITIRWRGGGNNTVKSISKTINVDGGSAVYGVGVFGVSVYDTGGGLFKVKVPCPGNGQQFQLQISGNAPVVFNGFTGFVEFLGAARGFN